MKFNFLFVFVLFGSLDVLALEILRVTPSGKGVSGQRQISILFSEEMVALGNMDVDSSQLPISITPVLNCGWQWVDQKNLTCNLGWRNGVENATKYKILIDQSFTSYKGNKLLKNYSFEFETIRPKVRNVNSEPMNYWSSPVRPNVHLEFNMAVERKSILKAMEIDTKVPYVLFPGKNINCSHDFCKNWKLKFEEDLEREKTYKIKIKKGLKAVVGELVGDEEFEKSFSTAPYFKLNSVECYYQKHGNLRKYFYKFEPGKNSDFSSNNICEAHLEKKINFSLPVNSPQISYENITIYPNPVGDSKANPFEMVSNFSRSYGEEELYLPDVLKSKTKYTFNLSKVKSIFNDNLKGPKDFTMEFLPRSPSVSVKYSHAVIEQNIDNDIPLLVTNMPEITVDYDLWNASGLEQNLSEVVKLETPFDVSYYAPLGIDKLTKKKPGIFAYKIDKGSESRRSNSEFFAQSTNFQVYAKMGHYNSLVWVLDMRTGKPVNAAEVQLSKFGGVEQIGKTFKTNRDGITFLPGISSFTPDLKLFNHYNPIDKLYVSVRKGVEFAALPLTSIYSTKSRRDNAYPRLMKKGGHIRAWGLTPQGVYKAGSDIDFKIFVRNEENKNLALPDKDIKYNLTIVSPTGRVFKELKGIKLTEFGTYSGKLFTSSNAVVGEYSFYLNVKNDYLDKRLHCFDVLISDFRPSPFRSLTNLNKKTFKKGEEIIVNGSAVMHSGGAYTGNDARITINLIPSYFKPSDNRFSSYSFYGSSRNYYSRTTLSKTTEPLDESGQRVVGYTFESRVPVATIFVETAVKDDRGKFIASRSSAKYFGADKFLGTKADKWSYKVGDKLVLDHVVLDSNSRLLKGEIVNVSIMYEKITAAKVKGSGNAFVTRYIRSWKNVHECRVEIKKNSGNVCNFSLTEPGYYKAISQLKGGGAEVHRFYVVGKGQLVWGGKSENLALITKKTTAKVGEKVKILVKNPYPKAKALITIERYGVIDQWVEDVSQSAYLVEFEAKPEYIPGFYVSVSLFSPRVGKAKGFGELDLAKPAFKTGYARYTVKDPYKEISVDLKSDKKKYLPQENVQLKFHAKARNGKLSDVELAIIVLDEAVFDLIKEGDDYFDPYKGLTNLDSLDVKSFSLIKNLIGLQKFEKKGANQGGGGNGKVRSFINYLAYWNPSVKLKNGKGEINFKLPDNLTGWKVLAVAADKKDRLGLSTSSFVVDLPTEIRPAIPNQIVEGDKFKARFTVMNRTSKTREIDVKINVSNVAEGGVKARSKNLKLKLEKNERRNVEIDVTAGKLIESKNVENASMRFLVEAGDNTHRDKLIKYLKVIKKRPNYFVSQYGQLLKNTNKEIDILFPQNIYKDVGGLQVSGSSTLIGNLEDGFEYFKKYPYACWEQKLSKAVSAAQFIQLKKYLEDKVKWNEANDLVTKTLKEAASFQLPSGAMSYYGKKESVYLSSYTAMAFSWLEDYGIEVDQSVKDKLITFLKTVLKNYNFPEFYSNANKASLRAIVLAAISEHEVVDFSEVDRLIPKISLMDKFSQFHLYQAAINLKADKKNSKKILSQIFNSLIIDSGKVSFNENVNDSWYRYHYSNKRTQCAALFSILNAVKEKRDIKSINDLPTKLLRTIFDEMKVSKQYWNSTQASLYCLNALISYANVFEKEIPNLKMSVDFGGKTLGSKQLKGYTVADKTINYTLQAEDIGKTKKLNIKNTGVGTLYYKAEMSYSSKESNSNLNHGIDLKKYISVKQDKKWQLVDEFTVLKRGDLVRVDLFLSVPTNRHFVIIDDPIAGGLEPINTQLATASTVDDNDNSYVESLSQIPRDNIFWYGKDYAFYHKELRNDRALFYSTYLSKGLYHVGYKAQVIATGKFTSSSAIAKEMYRVETYGSTSSKELNIVE